MKINSFDMKGSGRTAASKVRLHESHATQVIVTCGAQTGSADGLQSLDIHVSKQSHSQMTF